MHYYRLKLPFDNPLKSDFVFPNTDNISTPWSVSIIESKAVFSKELFSWFRSIRSEPSAAHIFYGQPHEQTPIHVDGIDNPESAAINWVYAENAPNSEMIWYNKLEEGNIEYFTNPTRSQISWNDSQVNISQKCVIESPTLVRTDIPHRVVNYSDTPRWCLSVRFRPTKSWDNIVKLLENYIVP